MAEQATKEPTMEEILASIRRIISEDGSPVGEASGADISAVSNDDDDFMDMSEDLSETESSDTDSADDAAGEHLLDVDELLQSDDGFEEIEALSDLDELSAEPETEIDLGGELEEVFAPDELAQSVAEIEADTAAHDEVEVEAVEEIETMAAPIEEAPAQEYAAEVETAPEATPTTRYEAPQSSALAGLGVGGATVEGLVAELMKPMIKEWIDSNLTGIVERKVEAEIQLVANKVVAALRDA